MASWFPISACSLAPGFASLRLQIHQQVQHLGGMIPAIDEVAVQHQVGVAADPGVLGVHQTGGAQHLQEALIVAMNVADRDDPADVVEGVGQRSGGPGRKPVPPPPGESGTRRDASWLHQSIISIRTSRFGKRSAGPPYQQSVPTLLFCE